LSIARLSDSGDPVASLIQGEFTMNQTETGHVFLVNGPQPKSPPARVMAQTQSPGTVAASVNQQVCKAQPCRITGRAGQALPATA
jgi:hypothetical protein